MIRVHNNQQVSEASCPKGVDFESLPTVAEYLKAHRVDRKAERTPPADKAVSTLPANKAQAPAKKAPAKAPTKDA